MRTPRPRRAAIDALTPGYERMRSRLTKSNRVESRKTSWQQQQLGTLGGGNHFIEICLDEADRVWVMLHSGSRGIGNGIGSHYIRLAKKEAQADNVPLPNRDLAYLREGKPSFDAYVEAMEWCQEYAARNRAAMMQLVLEAIRPMLPRFRADAAAVDCHHNYLSRERHFGADVLLTRKGAISARKDEWGIIPGSMGTCSYIVQGLGNPDSFQSCAHGAGRRMSRRAAKETYSVEDLHAQTEGVECRRDAKVVDEIPAAYKDIDEVMANQADLVKPVHTLKQVVCVKG